MAGNAFSSARFNKPSNALVGVLSVSKAKFKPLKEWRSSSDAAGRGANPRGGKKNPATAGAGATLGSAWRCMVISLVSTPE